VTITGPTRVGLRHFHTFAHERAVWIRKAVHAQQAEKHPDLIRTDRAHFLEHKHAALKLARQKVAKWNARYQFEVGRITVRQLKSRWGSCSSNGNLSFSYRILFLSEELQDYLVVHELCHLKEMNHSPSFWALVERTIPEYPRLRKEFTRL
jgi:predicted metal-dependent hydrolase